MLLLIGVASASPPPCATPEALDALAGRAAPTHAHMLAPPARLDGRPRAGADGKVPYGGNYAYHVDTANFTVNWWDADVDPAAAETAAEALEDAWTALVEEQGWTPPVSSDRYLIWVLLDPTLAATGYTTEYFTDEYPDGYPVIYLDPEWASQPEFWGALAAHEFMHALQYALREWDGTDAGESWYWEASASWASELTEPDRDGFQYASAWYAEQADLRFDSVEGYHQYGMFVLNAWLEEGVTGPGGMKAVWELSASDRSGWDALLATSSGLSTGELWGGFTGAYANGRLADDALYTPVALEGVVADGVTGSLPELGTHYYRATAPVVVAADGDVVLSGPDGYGDEVRLAAGDRLGVTALAGDAYALRVSEDDAGGEDTGEPGDTGGRPEVADGDLADDGAPKDGETQADCGCASGAPSAAPTIGLFAALAAGLRRRSRPT